MSGKFFRRRVTEDEALRRMERASSPRAQAQRMESERADNRAAQRTSILLEWSVELQALQNRRMSPEDVEALLSRPITKLG